MLKKYLKEKISKKNRQSFDLLLWMFIVLIGVIIFYCILEDICITGLVLLVPFIILIIIMLINNRIGLEESGKKKKKK